MNKLIKPKKQSYTGEDSQVVAYSVVCEAPWASIDLLRVGLALTYSSSPIANGIGIVCVIAYCISTAAYNI